jgi:hypothetical protein
VEAIKNLFSNRMEPPTLSPIGEIERPGSLLFDGARAYESIFGRRLMRRSPARVRRAGLLDRFLLRSSLRKIEADAAGNFDISVVLYPMGMDLAAWGIVVDRVGRVFEISPRPDGLVELSYQGGCCRTKREWKTLVRTRPPDDEQQIRMFYNLARKLAGGRIVVAGTVGFGLWDALWMSLDYEAACLLMEQQPDFATCVLRYWAEFHLDAVKAMLDAGIKIISFKEHPDGFPPGEDTITRVDEFVRDHLRDLSRTVHSRGGCLLLDCDADDMLHSDFPREWGFDGIGPLLFRDREDLIAAAAGLDHLLLVGALQPGDAVGRSGARLHHSGRVIMAHKPGDVVAAEERDSISLALDDTVRGSQHIGFSPLFGTET